MRPSEIGWRLGSARRRGTALWIPYDRTTLRHRPARLRQDPGPARPRTARRPRRRPGHPHQTRRPVPHPATHANSKPVDRSRCSTRSTSPPAPRSSSGTPSPGARTRCSPNAGRKAFAAGTIRGATTQSGDQAARFYAGECAKVLQAYFHAAALAGATLDDVLEWVANPRHHVAGRGDPAHPPASRHPCGTGCCAGPCTATNAPPATPSPPLQQALALFFQPSIRRRCVPTPARPATDIEALIRAGGTIYLLGREDPYASASPLMTAVAEDVLDTAKRLGETSPHGRLCPPFLACLDELPSTAPLPTLSTRMANERALGLSFLLAAQTWRQLVRLLRRGRSPHHPRPQQQPRRLRRRQGHRLLPRDVRPHRRRRHPPLRLQPRPDRPDPQLASHRHPDPATRRRPPDPATTGAAHLREQPGLPGPPTPLRRGTDAAEHSRPGSAPPAQQPAQPPTHPARTASPTNAHRKPRRPTRTGTLPMTDGNQRRHP